MQLDLKSFQAKEVSLICPRLYEDQDIGSSSQIKPLLFTFYYMATAIINNSIYTNFLHINYYRNKNHVYFRNVEIRLLQ